MKDVCSEFPVCVRKGGVLRTCEFVRIYVLKVVCSVCVCVYFLCVNDLLCLKDLCEKVCYMWRMREGFVQKSIIYVKNVCTLLFKIRCHNLVHQISLYCSQ